MQWESLAALAGGIGIFMLGMRHMSDGLKLAAGHRLEAWLAASTSTNLRAFIAGAVVTLFMQSSGLVSVLILGFVSAGILRFDRALYVLFGAGVATTSTGWLVALVGVNFKLAQFALPMIGIGAMFYLFRAEKRDGAFGQALLGFGMFFLGIDFLQSAFTGLADHLPQAIDSSYITLIGFAFAGFVITTLMQSSSASSAVTLSAVSAGTLGLDHAACILIGANIGSTTTALFASTQGSLLAKRLALANLLVNIGTAMVALAVLQGFLVIISTGCRVTSDNCSALILLASFNTLFNVLGTILFWPQVQRLTRWLAPAHISPLKN